MIHCLLKVWLVNVLVAWVVLVENDVGLLLVVAIFIINFIQLNLFLLILISILDIKIRFVNIFSILFIEWDLLMLMSGNWLLSSVDFVFVRKFLWSTVLIEIGRIWATQILFISSIQLIVNTPILFPLIAIFLVLLPTQIICILQFRLILLYRIR